MCLEALRGSEYPLSVAVPAAPSRLGCRRMPRHQLAAVVELVAGLGMLVCFVVLLAGPVILGLLVDLVWLVRFPPRLPLAGLGVNPHYLAGAPDAQSTAAVLGCGLLAAWLLLRGARRHE